MTSPGAGRSGSTVAVERRIDALEPDWDELADRTRATPFVRPGWIGAWWQAFGRGNLEILVARKDGRLCGVLPLYRRSGSISSTTNEHTPDFGLLAEDLFATRALVRALFARGGRGVRLGFLDAANPDFTACYAGAEAAGYRVLVRTLERSPYVEIDADWAAYEQNLSAKLISDLHRRRRRLAEEGNVSIEGADGSERLDELLAEGFAVEPSGWKAESAIVSQPVTRRFYTDVARWAAGRRSLRLSFLRLDGRALAFQYALEDGGAYYFIKGGYDPAYQRFAPGKLLLHALLERAFSIGLERFEFLGHDESWKLEWTNVGAVRERKAFRAFAPSLVGVAEWGVHAYVRPLVRRARLRRLAFLPR